MHANRRRWVGALVAGIIAAVMIVACVGDPPAPVITTTVISNDGATGGGFDTGIVQGNDGASPSDAGTDDTSDAGDDAADAQDADAGPTTIASLRKAPPIDGGVPVTLKGVVVTGHVTSTKNGKVWVQDMGGGPYSGIQIFCNYGGTTPNCASTRQQIDTLAIGTIIDVSGMFETFLLTGAPAGAQGVLEINAPTINITSKTAAPVPTNVTAAMVAQDQYAAAGAKPYEGSFVNVEGTSFAVSNVTPTEFATSCTDMSTPPQNGTTYGGFVVTGSGVALAVGLTFYNTLSYCIPCTGVAMPYTCSTPVTMPRSFGLLRGIVEPAYNTNGSIYLQISPITDSDL
jgi:hypothetical protein